MKIKLILLITIFLLPSITFANTSCDILTKGNNFYSSKKYKKALSTFKQIEDIDKIGTETCTDSIYATMATIYKIMGDKKLKSNSYKAAIFYKTASKYNRAFAYASLCSNSKQCKDSKSFWNIK